MMSAAQTTRPAAKPTPQQQPSQMETMDVADESKQAVLIRVVLK